MQVHGDWFPKSKKDEGGGAVGKLWRKHGGGYALWTILIAVVPNRQEKRMRKHLGLWA